MIEFNQDIFTFGGVIDGIWSGIETVFRFDGLGWSEYGQLC